MVKKTYSEALIQEVQAFPVAEEIDHGALLSLSLKNKTNNYTHGLHRFPAKFIPQVAEWALRSYASQSDLVLDPFVGSGTTLVEATRMGYDSLGLEINPLARLISQVKSTPLEVQQLRQLAAAIRTTFCQTQGELKVPIHGVSNFGHWFQEPTWRDLDALKSAILETPMDEASRDFFLVVFSSIIRWVSNADDQSQKTYVSGTYPKSPPEVTPIWDKHVVKAIDAMEAFINHPEQKGSVVVPKDGDALNIRCDAETIDLAVTSPPYLDSVDYPYNLMLEHFWLGPELGLPSRDDFNKLRKQQLGAKHPEKLRPLPVELSARLSSDDFHESRRKAAASYFAFMDEHFAQISRVLKPTGKYVMVVGNSRSTSGTLPVHESIARLAAANGLHLEHQFGYRIRRHYMKFPRAGRGGIILIDWVMTFSKAPSVVGTHFPELPTITLGHNEVAH